MIHCCFQIYTLEETASVLVSLASVFSQVGTLLLTTVVRASEATGNGIGFQTLNQPKGRKDTQQVSKHLPPADSLDCRGSLCFDLCLPTFFSVWWSVLRLVLQLVTAQFVNNLFMHRISAFDSIGTGCRSI
jgi:hypothetical protein